MQDVRNGLKTHRVFKSRVATLLNVYKYGEYWLADTKKKIYNKYV